jgi:hypothetical protein
VGSGDPCWAFELSFSIACCVQFGLLLALSSLLCLFVAAGALTACGLLFYGLPPLTAGRPRSIPPFIVGALNLMDRLLLTLVVACVLSMFYGLPPLTAGRPRSIPPFIVGALNLMDRLLLTLVVACVLSMFYGLPPLTAGRPWSTPPFIVGALTLLDWLLLPMVVACVLCPAALPMAFAVSQNCRNCGLDCVFRRRWPCLLAWLCWASRSI